MQVPESPLSLDQSQNFSSVTCSFLQQISNTAIFSLQKQQLIQTLFARLTSKFDLHNHKLLKWSLMRLHLLTHKELLTEAVDRIVFNIPLRPQSFMYRLMRLKEKRRSWKMEEIEKAVRKVGRLVRKALEVGFEGIREEGGQECRGVFEGIERIVGRIRERNMKEGVLKIRLKVLQSKTYEKVISVQNCFSLLQNTLKRSLSFLQQQAKVEFIIKKLQQRLKSYLSHWNSQSKLPTNKRISSIPYSTATRILFLHSFFQLKNPMKSLNSKKAHHQFCNCDCNCHQNARKNSLSQAQNMSENASLLSQPLSKKLRQSVRFSQDKKARSSVRFSVKGDQELIDAQRQAKPEGPSWQNSLRSSSSLKRSQSVRFQTPPNDKALQPSGKQNRYSDQKVVKKVSIQSKPAITKNNRISKFGQEKLRRMPSIAIDNESKNSQSSNSSSQEQNQKKSIKISEKSEKNKSPLPSSQFVSSFALNKPPPSLSGIFQMTLLMQSICRRPISQAFKLIKEDSGSSLLKSSEKIELNLLTAERQYHIIEQLQQKQQQIRSLSSTLQQSKIQQIQNANFYNGLRQSTKRAAILLLTRTLRLALTRNLHGLPQLFEYPQ